MITIHALNAAPSVFVCVCGCPGLPVGGSRFFCASFRKFLRCSIYIRDCGKTAVLLPLKRICPRLPSLNSIIPRAIFWQRGKCVVDNLLIIN